MRQKTKVYDYQHYWSQERDLGKYTEDKKRRIIEALKPLSFSSVLEIGSGQGELTRLLLDNFPIDKIQCVDYNRWYLLQLPKNPILQKTQGDILEWNTDEKFDLVIAAHVLLHIEPEFLSLVYNKMKSFANKYVVHIDPIKENINRKWEYYNFPHDYNKLHPTADFKQIEPYAGIWLEKS